MNKLDELEKSLKEYKEALEKQMGLMQTGMPPGTAGGGSAMNTSMDAQVEKKEHEDEKEDKKMIEEKLDEHNEKKHGEAKDADTAMKTELVKFDANGQWSLDKAEGDNLKGKSKLKGGGTKTQWNTSSWVKEAKEMKEKSKKNPVKTFKPGDKGFDERAKEVSVSKDKKD